MPREVVAVAGDHMTVAGGEYRHDANYEFVTGVIGAEVPSACQSNAYWLVTEVLATDPPRG